MGSDLMRPGSRDGLNQGPPAQNTTDMAGEQQMRNSGMEFYQRGRLSDYQRTDEDERRGEDRSALPDPSEIQNRLRDANRYS